MVKRDSLQRVVSPDFYSYWDKFCPIGITLASWFLFYIDFPVYFFHLFFIGFIVQFRHVFPTCKFLGFFFPPLLFFLVLFFFNSPHYALKVLVYFLYIIVFTYPLIFHFFPPLCLFLFLLFIFLFLFSFIFSLSFPLLQSPLFLSSVFPPFVISLPLFSLCPFSLYHFPFFFISPSVFPFPHLFYYPLSFFPFNFHLSFLLASFSPSLLNSTFLFQSCRVELYSCYLFMF